MEKLADNLQKLGEDDLLHVVEMVHNNKTPDTYTKNDVERKMLISHLHIMPQDGKSTDLVNHIEGEFHVDLYTLPDSLIRMLWDFSQEKLGA
jgi:transcription initiation factor IIF auxiliary subunit